MSSIIASGPRAAAPLGRAGSLTVVFGDDGTDGREPAVELPSAGVTDEAPVPVEVPVGTVTPEPTAAEPDTAFEDDPAGLVHRSEHPRGITGYMRDTHGQNVRV